jgi:hypothetical protein
MGRSSKYAGIEMSVYHLDGDIVRICEHFAYLVGETNADEYARRGQTDIEKIKDDIVIGKLAEWGVYFFYLSLGRSNISSPDMRIYGSKDKSFDPDLRWGNFNLHIKAQNEDSSRKFGDSWIMQSKDPLFGFHSEYDILIGCRVSLQEDGALVNILMQKPFKNIVFGETKMKKFSTNKRAIYLKDNQ